MVVMNMTKAAREPYQSISHKEYMQAQWEV